LALNLSAIKQKNSSSISKKASLTPAGGGQGTGEDRFKESLLKNIDPLIYAPAFFMTTPGPEYSPGRPGKGSQYG